MEFVVDTVGEITNPRGDRFRGVILAVPEGISDAQAREALRYAGSLWSARVVIAPAEMPSARKGSRP